MSPVSLPLGTRQLFIYWKLVADELDVAVESLRLAQHELAGVMSGLTAQRFVRVGGNRVATVMEVYGREAAVSLDGLSDDDMTHIDRVAARAVQPWVLGHRHLEVFDALAP